MILCRVRFSRCATAESILDRTDYTGFSRGLIIFAGHVAFPKGPDSLGGGRGEEDEKEKERRRGGERGIERRRTD